MGFRIVMLGAPGAGKGTQAKRLAEKRGLPHISTGDIFRAHLRGGTPLGHEVKGYLDAGQLVPDDLTCRIVAERLVEEDCQKGYILDGFPRTIPQAEKLDQVLQSHEDKLDVALNIYVPDDEIIDRLTARRFCPQCGAIYNLKYSPPLKDLMCDHDGTSLIQREDDKEETIRERLRVYHESTEPIEEYYQSQSILETVNGSQDTPDSIFAKIEDVLERVGASAQS